MGKGTMGKIGTIFSVISLVSTLFRILVMKRRPRVLDFIIIVLDCWIVGSSIADGLQKRRIGTEK